MPARVLVVDDDPAIRELLGEYLRGRGLDVSETSSGTTAIAALTVSRVDAVVVDLKLGDVDGIEVVRAASACDPPVATVAITGFGDVEAAIATMKAGASDLVLKPFSLRDLWAALDAAMAHARARALAEAAHALLVDAARADTAEDAEALVTRLGALVGGMGEGIEQRLGSSRRVSAPAEAAPYVRAVSAALLRLGL
ncbi:MAG: response regulator [Myxococcota bacterium]